MNTINDIAKLAAKLTDDPSAEQGVLEHDRNTRLVFMLIGLRTSRRLTQRQLAARMGVNASKICRMEAGQDSQLNWGDILKYLNVLGVNISLMTDDPSLPAAERIKHHVMAVHALLEQLCSLAREMGEGEAITSKIKEFYGEVLLNYMVRLYDSFSRLPQSGPINIEANTKTRPSKPCAKRPREPALEH